MGGEQSLQDWRKANEDIKGLSVHSQSLKKQQTVKTYRDLSWFELLEMFCHLFFAVELDLTLGTFIIEGLRRLFFFAGQYFPCGLLGICGGLS